MTSNKLLCGLATYAWYFALSTANKSNSFASFLFVANDANALIAVFRGMDNTSAYLATAIPTEIGPGNTGNNDFGASSLLTNSIGVCFDTFNNLHTLSTTSGAFSANTPKWSPISYVNPLHCETSNSTCTHDRSDLPACSSLRDFIGHAYGFACVGISLPLDISNDFLSLIFVNSFTFSASSSFLIAYECFSTSKSPSSPSAFNWNVFSNCLHNASLNSSKSSSKLLSSSPNVIFIIFFPPNPDIALSTCFAAALKCSYDRFPSPNVQKCISSSISGIRPSVAVSSNHLQKSADPSVGSPSPYVDCKNTAHFSELKTSSHTSGFTSSQSTALAKICFKP
mmetsp:Transcript_6715/g.20915  ORF Transcript_6715/g.20915 Transcript_6715/m.20915 type:complete len:339 (+) Transcript_6715:792-1808(+)